MKFHEQLNAYIEQIDCMAKEVSEQSGVSADRLLENFDLLLATLDVGISKLCRHINYDASTVFRFRNGSRRPSDPEKFASSVAEYVAREWDSARDRAVLAHLLGCTEEELAESSVRYEKLMEWLFDDRDHRDHPVSDFLFKLDEFNLNDYIKAIHFDELKVPSVPFQMPTSKTYFGLDHAHGRDGEGSGIPEEVDVRHGHDAEKGASPESDP